jgi:hypothetical protein
MPLSKQGPSLRVQTGVVIYQRKCSRMSGQKGTEKKPGGQTGEEMLPTALRAIGMCERGLSAARSGEKSLFFSLIPMLFL